MAYENIIAVFRTLSAANEAISELQAADIGASDIKLHNSDQTASAPTAIGLRAHFLSDEISEGDVDVYERCVAKGWVVVSVTVQMERADMVMAILASHAPVNLDESPETYGSTLNSPSANAQQRVVRRFSSSSNPLN